MDELSYFFTYRADMPIATPGDCGGNCLCDVEELYQEFKARLLSEVATSLVRSDQERKR